MISRAQGFINKLSGWLGIVQTPYLSYGESFNEFVQWVGYAYSNEGWTVEMIAQNYGVKVDYIKAILTVADPNYRYHEELKKTDTKLLNLEVI